MRRTPSRAPAPSWVAIPEDVESPTVIEFLDRRFPHVGREVWLRRLERARVLDERGHPVAAGDPCVARTRLRYFREVEDEPQIPFRETVLYRDRDLLVADKPHFLPVVPAGSYVNECLLYRLRASTGEAELTPVHRLDRATAGLVICSLRRETRGAYARLFARREVDKEYLAVARIQEPPAVRRWTLSNRLVRGTPPFRIRAVEGEPNAVTHLELLASEPDRGGFRAGVFRIRPETGKKHQIRFHLASLGFPIVHERYYPELLPEASLDLDRPLQLLARSLAFHDPVAGVDRVFVSERRLALDFRPE